MSALSLFRSLRPTGTLERPSQITGLPWQGQRNTLQQFVIDDIFGDIPELIDRAAAMKVPAVARGRNLLVGAIADLPLFAYRGDTRVETQPTWLYRADDLPLWHRMAYTLDDLIFNDASLWGRDNGADGFPIATWRIPIERWTVDDNGRIIVRDDNGAESPVDPGEVIYLPGPGGGLLRDGRDTIRGARAIDRAWIARTRSPIPPTLFVQKEQGDATEEEVRALIQQWSAARTNPDTAATAFVPFGIEAVFPQLADDSAMFIEGRNAIRLDIANLLNIPASLLDGSTTTASLTYMTVEGQRSSFHEQSLRYWMAPIEHRLSMDDIIPRGQRVRFDITYTTQVAPTGEPGEDS